MILQRRMSQSKHCRCWCFYIGYQYLEETHLTIGSKIQGIRLRASEGVVIPTFVIVVIVVSQKIGQLDEG